MSNNPFCKANPSRQLARKIPTFRENRRSGLCDPSQCPKNKTPPIRTKQATHAHRDVTAPAQSPRSVSPIDSPNKNCSLINMIDTAITSPPRFITSPLTLQSAVITIHRRGCDINIAMSSSTDSLVSHPKMLKVAFASQKHKLFVPLSPAPTRSCACIPWISM